jgi:hypothetical protein
MLAMEGNTAPYLQYAYTRIRSIFRKGRHRPRTAGADPLRRAGRARARADAPRLRRRRRRRGTDAGAAPPLRLPVRPRGRVQRVLRGVSRCCPPSRRCVPAASCSPT